jgi:small subunit ribosomal protein S1
MLENHTDPTLQNHDEPGAAQEPPSAEFLEAMRKLDHVLPIPNVGQKLHAVIRSISGDHAFADYGGRSEASIELKHLRSPEGDLVVEIGQRIEAVVVANEEGVVLAPNLVPDHSDVVRQLRDAQRSGIPVSAKVVGVNAGGVDVQVGGMRAFCPVSQIDATYCPDPSVFIGQTLEFRIQQVDDAGRRIVLSRRALLQEKKEEAAAQLRASLRAGEERDGTVVRLERFGAFVDLGGMDGMVHVSEISHDRVQTPEDVLKVGDRVRVRVLEIGRTEKGRDRISLSIKAAQADPWLSARTELQDGKSVSGRVVRLADFGAFVQILPGVEGLLHVTEIRDEPLGHPSEVLKEGETIEVRILSIDEPRRRISLSMRTPGTAVSFVQAIGTTVEGIVRAHKPYGVFIDLPGFGARTSGLLPLEESGVGRGGDLVKRFPVGEKIKVTVDQIDEKGRMRLALPAETAGRAPVAGGPKRGAGGAMAEALRRAMEGSQKPSA